MVSTDFNYGSWTYTNTAEATTSGVELYGTWRVVEGLTASLAYTYTEAEDGDGVALRRRPKDRVSMDLNAQPFKSLNVRLGVVSVGDRSDYDFNTAQLVELDGYLLVNLAARYAATDDMTLFGRVEILLDEQYQEVFGYGTAGLSGYTGMEYTF